MCYVQFPVSSYKKYKTPTWQGQYLFILRKSYYVAKIIRGPLTSVPKCYRYMTLTLTDTMLLIMLFIAYPHK